MPLSAVAIKNALPKAKDYKLYDERGLFLQVRKNGAKYWRLRYTLAGKEKLLSLGVYPEVSLKEAREQADNLRRQLRDGVDPSAHRKEVTPPVTPGLQRFELIARRWHKLNTPRWTPRYALKIMQMLERRVFPFLGDMAVGVITNTDVLNVLRRMENDDVRETTRKVRTYIQQIFVFAIAEGLTDYNPATGVIHALKALPPATHQRSLPFSMMPDFLKAIEDDTAHPIVKLSLQLLILTLTRTGEIRYATWDEIDFEKRLWSIPAVRMKMRNDHLIPLSEASLNVLRALHEHTGHGQYIARSPNSINKPLSENAFLLLIKRTGFKEHTTTHGLRATASTVLNEAGFRADVIEKQLAHEERNQVRKAYNRADYLDERRDMLEWWASRITEDVQ